MQHAFNDQTSQTALKLSLRSWWFVLREGKKAGKTLTKLFVISGADPGIFDGGRGGGIQTLVQKGLLNSFVANYISPITSTPPPTVRTPWPLTALH